MELNLARDVLDQELVDRNGLKMGRVDGLVLSIGDDGRPQIDHFELGFVVLARRLHPRIERMLEAIRKRWSVRKVGRQIVEWSSVEEITPSWIKVSFDATWTPAFDWERWFRDRVISKLPGGGAEE